MISYRLLENFRNFDDDDDDDDDDDGTMIMTMITGLPKANRIHIIP